MLFGKLSEGVPVMFPKRAEVIGPAKEIMDSIEEMKAKGDTDAVAVLEKKLEEIGIC